MTPPRRSSYRQYQDGNAEMGCAIFFLFIFFLWLLALIGIVILIWQNVF